jgi:uncharacterized membrane protein YuzA (DUF378 family)
MGCKSKNTQYFFLVFLLIPIVSGVMHWHIFTTDLMGIHLWRQSQTQINIQNFYRHDFNIFNPRNNSFNGGKDNIMRYEFPVMQWLIAANHKILGESIAITRISMFLIGLWGIWGLFFMLKHIFKDAFLAILGAWFFTFSPVFYYYTMNPLPDVFALSSIFWTIGFFFRFFNTHKWNNVFLSAVFLSLATLAKLPYIIFGSLVGAYVLIRYFRDSPKQIYALLKISLIYGIFLLPAFVWYKWVIPTWGTNGVLKGIFDNTIPLSKTLEILKFHTCTLLPKILINYAALPFFILSLYFMVKNKVIKNEIFWLLSVMGLSVIAYFLFEINMIDIVHDYYMMPFLPPLFILVVYGIREFLKTSMPLKWVVIALALAAPLCAYRAVQNYWSVEMSFCNPYLFIHKKDLRNAVSQNEKCIILNDQSTYVFSYLIDKQGFIFWNNELPVAWVEDMIKNYGVTYMYSDSRKVDERADFQPFIDSLIMQRGSVKVLKLKLPKR